MQQPIRIEICRIALDEKEKKIEDFFSALLPLYKNEKHFSLNTLTRHIQSLCSVGILTQINTNQGLKYILSNYGKTKIKKLLKIQ